MNEKKKKKNGKAVSSMAEPVKKDGAEPTLGPAKVNVDELPPIRSKLTDAETKDGVESSRRRRREQALMAR